MNRRLRVAFESYRGAVVRGEHHSGGGLREELGDAEITLFAAFEKELELERLGALAEAVAVCVTHAFGAPNRTLIEAITNLAAPPQQPLVRITAEVIRLKREGLTTSDVAAVLEAAGIITREGGR